MDIRQLMKVDLNLLVVLWVLQEEKSVSRTAERLFLTQSAVSKSLARLRELFDDPLFTRGGYGLVATPYVKSIIPTLAEVLNGVEHLLVPANFNPQTTRAHISVAFSQVIEIVVMPWLFAYLQRNAAGISVNSAHYDSNILQRLALGELDFAISMEYANYPPEFKVEKFAVSYPVLFARRGHALSGKVVSQNDVMPYPRLNLILPDAALIEFFRVIYNPAQEIARKWEVDFETESLITALSIVRMTDSLLPGPDLLSKMLVASPDLDVLRVKDFASEELKFVLVSHQRTESSVMHQWFRSVLLAIGEQMLAEKSES